MTHIKERAREYVHQRINDDTRLSVEGCRLIAVESFCEGAKQPITVEFDNCLNDLGWEMNTFLTRNGATFDGRVFNNMKGFLKGAIEKYIASKAAT